MEVSAVETRLEHIRNWRDMYRLEMSCQIVHDSIHDRPGWTREYCLSLAGTPVGMVRSQLMARPKPTVRVPRRQIIACARSICFTRLPVVLSASKCRKHTLATHVHNFRSRRRATDSLRQAQLTCTPDGHAPRAHGF